MRDACADDGHRLVRKSFGIASSIEAIVKKPVGGPDVHRCARPGPIGAVQDGRARRVFTRAGHAIPLAPKTFDLLVCLVQSDGRAVAKQELMTALWPDTFVEEANLAFQISTLRKAPARAALVGLKPFPSTGFRFVATVREGREDRGAG